jgi:hypothetical protein
MFIKLTGIFACLVLLLIGPQANKPEKIVPAQTEIKIEIPKTVEPEIEIKKEDAIVPAPVTKNEVTKSSAPSKVTPSKPKAAIEKSGKINTPIVEPKVEVPKVEVPKVEAPSPKIEIPNVVEPTNEVPKDETPSNNIRYYKLPPEYQPGA